MTSSQLQEEARVPKSVFEQFLEKVGDGVLGSAMVLTGLGMLGFLPLFLFLLSLLFFPEHSNVLAKTSFALFSVSALGVYFLCVHTIFFSEEYQSNRFLSLLFATGSAGYTIYYLLTPVLK